MGETCKYDSECKSDHCGQFKNNEYKCCNSTYTPFGSVSDWCDNLSNGQGCYYDGQCNSGICLLNNKCIAPRSIPNMNNNLTNWQNVRCESNNNCVSNKCFNYYAGGTKYCWPKDSVWNHRVLWYYTCWSL